MNISSTVPSAMREEQHRHQSKNDSPISEYFGEATFSLKQMRERLPSEALQDLTKCLEQGRKMSVPTADAVALAVKDWAVTKGATHFCHWFQPMTGITAEKHEAFIAIQNSNFSELSVLERFSGSQLVQSEPDASSFPSGGMRTTFEARGYTAWDPTSPLFIIDDAGSKTLCIPSIFFGYHGESLDNKTPLLRSVQSLSKEMCKFLKLIGDVDVKKITPTLGAEQEYFLVDRKVAAQRPDLIATGRSLIGAQSERGQNLGDHYFGSIPSRVKAYMVELEQELYHLGVPVQARHNEVAPGQYELAQIFENITIAADHNTLIMETMKRIALRHGLLCLLHEKPFSGVNGSGKHCNWSISNDKGANLLEPGRTPHQNLRFLAVMAIVIKAVNDHASVLSAQIMSAGNEQRLGSNEAPSAIISVFLGNILEDILENIASGDSINADEQTILDLGISHIPNISKDYTDRNRTSPFAFTGNKFEFRAVGSSANVSVPMAVLNAAVTDATIHATKIIKSLLEDGKSKDEATIQLVRMLISENKNILYNGDNYSQEWLDEAKKRNLSSPATCSDAFEILSDTVATEFLVLTSVFSAAEIDSRTTISIDRFVKTKTLEYQTLMGIIIEFVVPSLEKQLIQSHLVLEKVKSANLRERLNARISTLETTFSKILQHLTDMEECMSKMSGLESSKEKMVLIYTDATPLNANLRTWADKAEQYVSNELWGLPKYRDLLFHESMT